MNIVRGNNEVVPMTRRYPNLKQKVLKRDSEIVKKLLYAWDIQKDNKKGFDIYLKEKENLSDERYWELLRTVWILCGSVETAFLFRRLFMSTRKERYYFSTPEESKKLREMPETFKVYRATNNENDGGLSWTVSKEYAEYYKSAFVKEKVISKVVSKKDVFAFIERNQESEILIL